MWNFGKPFVCATGTINRDPNYWTTSVQRQTIFFYLTGCKIFAFG